MKTPDEVSPELLAAYPEIAAAVHCAEFIFHGECGGDSPWREMDRKQMSPAARVEKLRQSVVRIGQGMLPKDRYEAILAQIDHPKFLTYIAGKMGAGRSSARSLVG